jgi:hypothetical protein
MQDYENRSKQPFEMAIAGTNPFGSRLEHVHLAANMFLASGQLEHTHMAANVFLSSGQLEHAHIAANWNSDCAPNGSQLEAI